MNKLAKRPSIGESILEGLAMGGVYSIPIAAATVGAGSLLGATKGAIVGGDLDAVRHGASQGAKGGLIVGLGAGLGLGQGLAASMRSRGDDVVDLAFKAGIGTLLGTSAGAFTADHLLHAQKQQEESKLAGANMSDCFWRGFEKNASSQGEALKRMFYRKYYGGSREAGLKAIRKRIEQLAAEAKKPKVLQPII